MAKTHFTPQPVRTWFWFGAAGFLLFMATGVGGYLLTVMTPIEQVPADRRPLMEAMPDWQTAVYAVAVWSGLAGAIGLLLRRRWSVPLLLLSLAGGIGTFLPFAIIPAVRDLGTTSDAIAAVIVITLCLACVWFARDAQQRGWLR